MKFSIIVPVYNVEEFLEEALNSIECQDFKDFEVILINDGSTDNSRQICERYAEEHDNVLLINKENDGLSSARNLGIQKARGEYIYFFDSDDYMHPNLLSTVEEYVSNSDIDMVQFRYQSFKNHQLENVQMINTHLQFDKVYTHQELLMDMCNYNNELLYTAWSYVIKRDVIIKLDLKFIPYIINEDVTFIIECLSNVKNYIFIPQVLYFYRLRGVNYT